MALDPKRLAVQQRDQLSEVQGEVHGLKGVLAILIAHISLLTRAPLVRREEILRGLTAILPDALAQIEHDAPPAVAAGFERAIEGVTHMARNAVRIEPVMSAQPHLSGCERWRPDDARLSGQRLDLVGVVAWARRGNAKHFSAPRFASLPMDDSDNANSVSE